MHEDSPPPFIVIRTPAVVAAPRPKPYDRALELVGLVHQILDQAQTRFYLKDRLDRSATKLVFEIGHAVAEVPSLRWRSYRAARAAASECATTLDIMLAQRAAPEADLTRARALARELLADITPLGRG
jgi:hypothetical protein